MNDFFGKNASRLKKMKLFLLDMDGTIYKEGRLFDGTVELLETIKSDNGKYVFITNNSSKSVKDYISKIRSMGISADSSNFFTSTQAAIYLLKSLHPNTLVYCQGTNSFIQELYEADINVTTEYDENADIVLVGFDTELTTEKLRRTCHMLTRDIPFYATNPDLACPVSFGFVPDCGSICQMIENATGKKPIYIGKPNSTMVNIVREKFGYKEKDTVVVGDRLYTDIACGHNAGVSTICVLTGEATIESVLAEKIKPTYTFHSVKEINEALKN